MQVSTQSRTQDRTVEQIYTGCLAQAAYYLESRGEAAIIDPLRDPQPYLDRAQRSGAKIRWIFETHFHADFVSGHLELQRLTGATIVYGPSAKPHFPAHIAKDGEIFPLGDIAVRVLHTPGHTLESSCFALLDAQQAVQAVFTGDTLFLGDVGRPDLAVRSDLTQEQLAGKLYDSLHTQLLTLPDDVVLYPGHGAGSACGKHLAKETQDTLGHQKQVNYALRATDKATFVKEVLSGLTTPPAYFPANARLNREGYAPLTRALGTGLRALTPDAFEIEANGQQATILDTRSAAEFARAFVPQSIHIGLDGQFASWVGSLIGDLNQPILLVTAPGREQEAVTRLTRIGFDRTLGYLLGGIDAWVRSGRETDSLETLEAIDLRHHLKSHPETEVLDVRTPEEFERAHLGEARSLPLGELNARMGELSPSRAYVVQCAGGYRSSMAASILKSRGFGHIANLNGGLQAIEAAGLPLQAMDVSGNAAPSLA